MTESTPLPSGAELQEKIDNALTEIMGIHAGWVLAIETIDVATGQPFLHTIWDRPTVKWTQLGMARALVMNLEEPFSQMEDG